ncbi:MAG: hypothetical protein M3Q05_13890 [Bacteroidota bacterium]|nr:hypothetical protein [Bacteroidota bacterium]
MIGAYLNAVMPCQANLHDYNSQILEIFKYCLHFCLVHLPLLDFRTNSEQSCPQKSTQWQAQSIASETD